MNALCCKFRVVTWSTQHLVFRRRHHHQRKRTLLSSEEMMETEPKQFLLCVDKLCMKLIICSQFHSAGFYSVHDLPYETIHLVSWNSVWKLRSAGHSNYQLLILSTITNTGHSRHKHRFFSTPARHTSSDIHLASYLVGVGGFYLAPMSTATNPRPLYALTVWFLSTQTALPYNTNITVISMEKSPSWKLIVAQILKKFFTFYGTHKFITAFTRARHRVKPLIWRTPHCRLSASMPVY
jgi:hypothetical protein